MFWKCGSRHSKRIEPPFPPVDSLAAVEHAAHENDDPHAFDR